MVKSVLIHLRTPYDRLVHPLGHDALCDPDHIIADHSDRCVGPRKIDGVLSLSPIRQLTWRPVAT